MASHTLFYNIFEWGRKSQMILKISKKLLNIMPNLKEAKMHLSKYDFGYVYFNTLHLKYSRQSWYLIIATHVTFKSLIWREFSGQNTFKISTI